MKIRDNTTVTVSITVTSGPSWSVTTLAGASVSEAGGMDTSDMTKKVKALALTCQHKVIDTLDAVWESDEQEEKEAIQ